MTPNHFSDPAAVARYAEGPPRQVPGFDALQRMVDQILSESVPDDGRVLVVGAGGGLELRFLAERHDRWSFDGVDPSADMLRLAKATMGSLAHRATLHEGYVTDAPEGPFDGATCLLTLHFVPADERLSTLREIRRRLRPGAPLLTIHHSAPGGHARRVWLERSVRFASGAAADPDQTATSAGVMDDRLPILTPAQDEALLLEAGFSGVETYYAALSFRGWIAYA
jgi:tRNA (cmo5U34)-methyltransferase